MAVILGLSEEEQLQASVALRRLYLQRAGATSVLILLIAGLVFYLSRQLQRSRQRILDEQVSHAQRVEYLAYHDGLTGLPNRSYFSQLLNRGIGEAKRYERRFALLFLDLDRFKIINDTLGHDAGDELLIEVAKRLNQALRETDTVARLGGDEFVVLLPEMNEEAQLSAVARKVLSAVGQPFRLAEQDLRITVSIGISVFPGDGEDEQTLLKNADIAMYHAKEGGKNNYAFYSEELNADSLERLALESSLRQALDEDQFVLFYQEKHDIHSNKITGAEALLRWQHPNLGLVLPHQFLPLAEETGLIIPIGKWVLETACHQAVDWIAQGQAPRCVSINLTARQFTDAHLLGDIREALQSTGLDPQLLELEISENLLLSDFDRGLDILHHIKALGVRIAIGNFGTGYTSLSTLETFQFDTLKIDGSVIRDVTREDSDRQLTEAIIAVGRAMAMTIVAEGVETREQAEFLLNSSCDQVQGFYYDKPSPSKRLN
ncbi:diguanylate cyclase [Gammaproteobacteria bacterium 53_120_T64]|nr:diguanylate cyclase [Gammaproteobacteria bacterium 53_120_T64]